MRRWLGFFCVMIALLSGVACAEEFALENGVSWAASPEKVAVLLPDDFERADDSDPAIGAVTILRARQEELFGFTVAQTDYFFFNDALCTVSLYCYEKAVPDAQGLIEAVSEIYGEPRMCAENEFDLSSYLSNIRTWCKWNPDTNTQIQLKEPLYEYPYRYIISFTNLPAEQKFEDAMTTWYESAEAVPQEEE